MTTYSRHCAAVLSMIAVASLGATACGTEAAVGAHVIQSATLTTGSQPTTTTPTRAISLTTSAAAPAPAPIPVAPASTTVALAVPPQPAAPAPLPSTTPPAPTPIVYYANCAAVRAVGAAPLHRGDPGYRSQLDRDNDGIACE